MARSRSTGSKPPQRLILDSGAVISLSRDEKRVNVYLERALEYQATVEIPAVVVAETIRGGPKDASVHRIINMIGNVTPTTETHGRIAGALLGEARSSSTIDALVVAHAVVGGGAVVLTGDLGDLGRLAASHPEVWVQSI
jgi:predicted nucleic acid-binding protein